MQELLEVRDFVNEGGRVLYTGQRAGQQYTPALGTQLYDPFENRQCRADPGRPGALPGAVGLGQLAGRPDRVHVRRGDHVRRAAGSIPDTGDPFDVAGIDDPFAGLTWERNGADSAQNQAIDSSFIATGDFLEVTDPADSFPQFESWPAAEYRERPRGPVRPAHRRSRSCGRDRADEAYKRLTRTITVPGRRRDRCRSGRASTSSSTSTT